MNWQENMNRSKEVLSAQLRQGAKELAGVLYGPGTAAQPSEYGMPFTKLPSEIAQDMKGEGVSEPSRDDAAPSILDRYTQPVPESSQAGSERGADLQPEQAATERDAVEHERD